MQLANTDNISSKHSNSQSTHHHNAPVRGRCDIITQHKRNAHKKEMVAGKQSGRENKTSTWAMLLARK